ncbi:MAG: hypothetical protein KA444_05120 [Bacteroidia bacterium]|nr:hypothetical protein [Bacteroidia bacterium]
MKTITSPTQDGIQPRSKFQYLKTKAEGNRFAVYVFELVLLYLLVFATVSAIAQEPATASKNSGKLEFVKETIVFNSGKVYLNWVAKENSDDCIYVIERSADGKEFEPVGLKEGIGSPLELLYSWVDSKPLAGTSQYRIKQINNEGTLVAEADAREISSPDNPLYIDKNSRLVQVK